MGYIVSARLAGSASPNLQLPCRALGSLFRFSPECQLLKSFRSVVESKQLLEFLPLTTLARVGPSSPMTSLLPTLDLGFRPGGSEQP